MTMPAPIIKNGAIALIALVCGAALQATSSARETDTVGVPLTQARCIDILRHGADRTGVRDSAAAFGAAVSASDSAAICIYVPAGTYRFTSSPTLTLRAGDPDAAIAIKGDGSGLSRLVFDTDVSGPVLRLNGSRQSFHIRDISILAGGKDKTATGLAIIQQGAPSPNPAQSDITGVTIRGKDGFGVSDRFARGMYLNQVSNVSLTNTVITGSRDGAPYATQGICLSMDGTAASIPVQINIVSSQINHCGVGLRYGPYVQGLQIIGSNFVGNGTAIHQPASNVGNDQLAVTASQFNSGLHNILLEAPIDGVTIGANDFYIAEGGVASVAMPGVQFAIQGNSFTQLGTAHATAITIGAFMLDAGVITGNSFNNFATAILLHPGSGRVNVQSNAYSDIKGEKVVNRGKGNVVGGGSP
jgi:hypothetical protein